MSKIHVVSLGDSAKERETRKKVSALIDSGMLSELRDVFNQYEKQCDTK
jgi:hypothetical protein